MKKSRFREEQIIGLLKQGEAVVKTVELRRERDFCGGVLPMEAEVGGMEVAEAQRLKSLEDENRRLKMLGQS